MQTNIRIIPALMNNKPTVSYIVPAYQAESFIYNNLRLFSDYCLNSKDGSADSTDEIIEAYLNENGSSSHLKYVNLKKNVGKGRAIKEGLEVAEGQFIVFTDCDLPYSFKNIDNVINKL